MGIKLGWCENFFFFFFLFLFFLEKKIFELKIRRMKICEFGIWVGHDRGPSRGFRAASNLQWF